MTTNAADKRLLMRRAALEYHEQSPPGKLAVVPTKQLLNQHDLALAYSPGVASACEEIVADPVNAFRYTARGNLVAVISNGTAVLGLGNIGALAAKPVMEGKAVLFKKFAGIDVFDLEISEADPEKLVEIIAALEPTFGGINLEDIKAPDCFYVERKLRERMSIPVFHDDQHGTAIVVAAAILNGLEVAGKDLRKVKLVTSGAGAAALACLATLVKLGLPLENILVTDLAGVVYAGRTELMDDDKRPYARETAARTLSDVIEDADVFLGLSAGGVLKPEMVRRMAARPLVFALANPTPEITPEEIRGVRDDAIIATGRADYPNQVNNVLCFPYIFRGALDCRATTITSEMELAAVRALAQLAHREPSEALNAYAGEASRFGADYLIPKPFDPRLMLTIAPAVAKAAAESGVALKPIEDMAAYQQRLQAVVYASGTTMQPIFAAAKGGQLQRIAYAEGEEERVLRAVQVVVDEGLARPTLIGRPAVIRQRVAKFGLRLEEKVDYDVVNVDRDERYRDFWKTYHGMMERRGVTEQLAKIEMRRRLTLIAAMLLHKGDVDGVICGTWGTTDLHLRYVDQVIGRAPGAGSYACMTGLLLPGRLVFLADTEVNLDPSAEELAEITLMAAAELRRFGLTPNVALLSHSSFGSSNAPSAQKMRRTLALVRQQCPGLAIDGEMQGDSALDAKVRLAALRSSTLNGQANLLVFPGLDAANIASSLLKAAAGGGIAIGPILLGTRRPIHIVTPAATVRRIVNMTALTAAQAKSVLRTHPESGVMPPGHEETASAWEQLEVLG